MIFPVTGFPCSGILQNLLDERCVFRSARFVMRDFRDSTALRHAAQVVDDEIFIAKAAWLSEILYRILLRTKFQTEPPPETRNAAAAFLAIKPVDCTTALLGLLYLSTVNKIMLPLARCFAGSEKIPQLAFLAKTPAGERLLRLLDENSGSIDDQLQALILHMPGLLTSDERNLIRRIASYDRSARAAAFNGGGSAEFPLQPQTGAAISRSADSPWMRELVLLAKIVPVWLADLSRRHGKQISRLDEIPEDEIARIAAFGVNGIWLVGLWQRSAASARIKTLTGGKNYSSAYSVFDYRVAGEWGGDSALQAFRAVCERHGIRLGCDMVPNHTGIDSKWIREHPDWFIQTEANPFPSYTFVGENLSGATDMEIRIEDHYYDKSDAAVVFACDCGGRRRYIYHGNDGTGLPWNDTAQLDHTNPAVRRAIIDVALYLAQNFSIIRFDAAMTLTRDHYRRLWFPGAEEAPAIASRSIFGLTASEFDARMPVEFWTELVEEFRRRANDTLLVAEAFWMTEMYFVRSLGMHRVYNSAFMHSLRDEKNAEFETNLKTFRSQDADTLSRFVNYLSTPDEESAASLFDNDEKYLGAMLLMATLPGLPMLAPGQLEGYREKYGMDQHAPQSNESVREDLAANYLRRITPFMRRRAEFCSPQALDFPVCGKSVGCIAYITGTKGRHLVVFNNSAHAGRISLSGQDFCALFDTDAATLQWSNAMSGEIGRAEKGNLLSQGFSMHLDPYQSAVLTGFGAAQQGEAPQSRQGLIAVDRHYSGVAVPVAALISRQSCGIGEFGDLKLLIDWCAATRQSMINILPINDTGMNSSPYSALSAMALHPVYIRLDELPLTQSMKARVAEMRLQHTSRPRVAFQEIAAFKEKILREVYFRDRDESIAQVPREFRDQRWLVEYAVYRHLKERFAGSAWFQWNADNEQTEEVRELLRDPEWHRIEEYFVHNIRQVGFYVWVQYQLHRQLTAVKMHADARGIFLKGDMPIMLERDSVDVWLNKQLFNHHLRAGAPPDMFSPEGQNWGFPVYNWPAHEQQNFSWWRERISQLANYFSAYRIDHVLGFFRLWCIPEEKQSGREGFYQPTETAAQLKQGKQILSLLRDASQMLPCAEDLGVVPDYVRPALAELGILSLKVYRWEAENNIPKDPQAYPYLSLATSSVHDSSNLREWLASESSDVTGVEVKGGGATTEQIHNFLLRLYQSPSMVVMIPLQDLLALDAKLHGDAAQERVNIPGTVSDFNWTYRMPLGLEDLLFDENLLHAVRDLVSSRPING